MTFIYFIIALSILVLVHEWGHFIVARRSGIRVLKFSIGFGPKIFGIQKGDTEYRISLIPLGGYVQLFGEDPEAEGHGDIEKIKSISQAPDAFSGKPLPSRFATVLAGPFMNIVLAFLFMPIAFMIGRFVPEFIDQPPVVLGIQPDSPASQAGFEKGDLIVEIDGQKKSRWGDVLNWIVMHPDAMSAFVIEREGKRETIVLTTARSKAARQRIGYVGIEPFYFWGDDPVIGGFAPDSPAEKAGLAAGDKIVVLNGKEINSWTAMTQVVRGSNGQPLRVEFEREGVRKGLSIQPRYDKGQQIWMIGVSQKEDVRGRVKKRYPFGQAVLKGTGENIKLASLTGEVVWQLVTFQLSYKTLGGPVQIAQATAQAAKTGVGDLFYFLAFLSLQLGILNLLPIPVLDGGHLFFMGIEAIRRRPVSLKVRSISQQVGLALLLTLMILVTANDIDSVWGFGSLWEKIKGIF